MNGVHINSHLRNAIQILIIASRENSTVKERKRHKNKSIFQEGALNFTICLHLLTLSVDKWEAVPPSQDNNGSLKLTERQSRWEKGKE